MVSLFDYYGVSVHEVLSGGWSVCIIWVLRWSKAEHVWASLHVAGEGGADFTCSDVTELYLGVWILRFNVSWAS